MGRFKVQKITHQTSGDTMKRALIRSVFFHGLVVLAMTVSLPFIRNDDVIVTPVPIEIVDIDEITQTNKPPAAKPKEPEPPKPPPVQEADMPPDLTKDSPKEDVQEPEDIQEPNPVVVPDEKVEEKPLEEKPKDKPKEKEEPKPKEKARDINSVLKNLALDEPAEKTDESEVIDEPAPVARLGDRLTISELDAFKRQIEPCWNIPSGAKFAENLNVEIRVFMNPDASLRDASILDKTRYTREPAFQAAADSAMRALRNPRCSPLSLPLDKYDRWKTIVINFDPRDAL